MVHCEFNRNQLDLIQICLRVTKKSYQKSIEDIGKNNSFILQSLVKEIDELNPIIQEYINQTEYNYGKVQKETCCD